MSERRQTSETALRPVPLKPSDGEVLPPGELMERIIAAGDLRHLSPQDRAHYIVRVCEGVGLNPLSQPFDLIPGPGGALKLYANKSGTDQLRRLYRLRTITRGAQEINGCYVVTVEVTDERRTESNIGAVPIEGLKGEALASAMKKSHTQAKRRATLDWCGLGLLDAPGDSSGDDETLAWGEPGPGIDATVVDLADEAEAPERENLAFDPYAGEFDTGGLPPIDRETGEILEPDAEPDPEAERLAVMAQVQDIADELSLDGQKVQALAKSIKANYRTVAGAEQLRSALLEMLPDAADAERWRR